MNKTTKPHNTRQLASRIDRLIAMILPYVMAILIGVITFPIHKVNPGLAQFVGFSLLIIMVVINLLLIVRRSQSIGKFLMNIQVVEHTTGERYNAAAYLIIRELFGKTLLIGAIPWFGGFFMLAYFPIDILFIFSKSKRTLHDRIAGTDVIKLAQEKHYKYFFDFTPLT